MTAEVIDLLGAEDARRRRAEGRREHGHGDGLDVLTGLDQPIAVRLFGQDQAVLAAAGRQDSAADGRRRGRGRAAGRRCRRPSPRSRSRSTWRRPAGSVSPRVTSGGPKPPCCRASRSAASSSSRRSSTSSSRAFQHPRERGRRPQPADGPPGGGYLRLGDVADVRMVDTPSVISRDAVSRRLDIVAGVDGRSGRRCGGRPRAQLADLELPDGVPRRGVAQTTADEIGTGRVVGFGGGRPARGVPAAAGGVPQLAAGHRWRWPPCRLPWSAVWWHGAHRARASRWARCSGFLAVLGLAVRFVRDHRSARSSWPDWEAAPDPGRLANAPAAAAGRFGPGAHHVLAVAALALPFVGPRRTARPGDRAPNGRSRPRWRSSPPSWSRCSLLPAAYLHLATRPGPSAAARARRTHGSTPTVAATSWHQASAGGAGSGAMTPVRWVAAWSRGA